MPAHAPETRQEQTPRAALPEGIMPLRVLPSTRPPVNGDAKAFAELRSEIEASLATKPRGGPPLEPNQGISLYQHEIYFA